ncbi:DUF3265 domain-containing protein [Vibrio diazotrophicus]|nr:DUF3265 domain-containing protein [Vibrio diazotrophicus]
MFFQSQNVQKTKTANNCSRVTRYAQHLYYAFVLVVQVLCKSLIFACLTHSQGARNIG